MSRISEMAHGLMHSKLHGEGEMKKKVAMSIRLDKFSIYCLDKFAAETETSRTAIAVGLVEEGVLDGLETLGFTLEELKEGFLKEKEEENV